MVTLLVVLLLIDVADACLGQGEYDVPAALFGLVGTAIGGLYAPELVRRLRNGRAEEE